MPAPGGYSARCSSVTFKHEVGTFPSTKPLSLTFSVWVSDIKPVTSGTILRNVIISRIGSLMNFNMQGWVAVQIVLPSKDKKSTLIYKIDNSKKNS